MFDWQNTAHIHEWPEKREQEQEMCMFTQEHKKPGVCEQK